MFGQDMVNIHVTDYQMVEVVMMDSHFFIVTGSNRIRPTGKSLAWYRSHRASGLIFNVGKGLGVLSSCVLSGSTWFWYTWVLPRLCTLVLVHQLLAPKTSKNNGLPTNSPGFRPQTCNETYTGVGLKEFIIKFLLQTGYVETVSWKHQQPCG